MPAGARIVFERTPCLGSCPVYTLVLHDDGRIDWTGKDHVSVTGPAHHQTTPDDVAQLWQRLQAWHERDLAPTNPEDGCARAERSGGTTVVHFAETDMPGTKVSLIAGDARWTVVHDHGCPSTPALERLQALEDEIDAVAGAVRWIEPLGPGG